MRNVRSKTWFHLLHRSSDSRDVVYSHTNLVSVTVMERCGQPLAGLCKADFKVYDDKLE